MWYSNSTQKKVIDYSKPIISENKGYTYLLMPQIGEDSYCIIGYNWFCITTGTYNSCCCFATAEAACKSYSHHESVRNAEISII